MGKEARLQSFSRINCKFYIIVNLTINKILDSFFRKMMRKTKRKT